MDSKDTLNSNNHIGSYSLPSGLSHLTDNPLITFPFRKQFTLTSFATLRTVSVVSRDGVLQSEKKCKVHLSRSYYLFFKTLQYQVL